MGKEFLSMFIKNSKFYKLRDIEFFKHDTIVLKHHGETVVHMATLGSNQSERSKIGLDQSESRIWPMWLIDVTNQGFNPRDL